MGRSAAGVAWSGLPLPPPAHAEEINRATPTYLHHAHRSSRTSQHLATAHNPTGPRAVAALSPSNHPFCAPASRPSLPFTQAHILSAPTAVHACCTRLPYNVPPHAQVFQCGAGLEDEEPLAAAGLPPALRAFDLVVANILRGPLIELRERLTGWVGNRSAAK